MSTYVLYQPNPRKHSTNDCVIRAFCKLFSKSWRTIFKELAAVAIENARTMDDPQISEKYLIDHGFKAMRCPIVKGQKRITVAEFAKKHPEGKYAVKVAHHIVAVIDGKYYDSWDSGEKCIYKYFSK